MPIKNRSKIEIKNKLSDEQEAAEEGNWYNEELTIAINNTIKAIKNDLDTNQTFLNDAEKNKYEASLNKLEADLKNEVKNYNTYDYYRSHQTILDALALKINICEDEIVAMINHAIERQNKNDTIDTVTNYDTIKYYNKNPDGSLTLNKATNRPKIHEVLGSLVKKGTYWKIDYKNIETTSDYGRGLRIKNKMLKYINEYKGGKLNNEKTFCYVTYGKDKKTGQRSYLLCDGQGKQIVDETGAGVRALIRDGVTLTPSHIDADIARDEEQQKEQNEKYKYDKEQLKKQMPASLLKAFQGKETLLDEFLEMTEKTITDKAESIKKIGGVLTDDPICSRFISSQTKFMLIRYIIPQLTGSSWMESNIKEDYLFTETMSDDLFDLLDSNEDGLAEYCTKRLYEKFGKAKVHTENIGTLNEDSEESEKLENPGATINGLSLVKDLLDKLAPKIDHVNIITDQWLRAGSQNLEVRACIGLSQDITNAITSIRQGNFGKEDLEKILQKSDDLFHRLAVTRFHDIYEGGDIVRKIVLPEGSDTKEIKENQINNYRKLGNLRKLESSTLTTEETRKAATEEEDLTIKETTFNDCLKNIEKIIIDTDMNENGEISPTKKQFIDQFYGAGTPDQIFDLFIDNGYLPSDAQYNDYKDEINQFFNTIQEKNKEIAKLSDPGLYKEQLSKIVNEYRINETASLEEQETINKFEYLLENEAALSEFMEDFNKSAIDLIKYNTFENSVKGCLFHKLADFGGGLVGDSEFIKNYNDSIGIGWFTLSDENAERATQITKLVAEEVVYIMLTIALSETIIGSLATGAKAIKGLKTIRELCKKFKLIGRITKALDKCKVLKAATEHIVSFTCKGISFQFTHTIYQNVLHGKGLFDNISMKEHPLEYVKSVAFFAIAKGLGQLNEQWFAKIMRGRQDAMAAGTSVLSAKLSPAVLKGVFTTLGITAETAGMVGLDRVFSAVQGEDYNLTAEELLPMITIAILTRCLAEGKISQEEYERGTRQQRQQQNQQGQQQNQQRQQQNQQRQQQNQQRQQQNQQGQQQNQQGQQQNQQRQQQNQQGQQQNQQRQQQNQQGQQQNQEQARRQQQEQEEARRQQQEQEEARRQQQEQEEARRQQQEQEEARRQQQEQEEARRQQQEQEEARRQQQEQEEARRQQQEQEEARRQQQEQEEARRQQQEQEEARRQQQEQEEARRQQQEQEEARRQQQEQEEARRQQQEQEEARRQQQEQEEARRQQQEQEEARRQQQEQEEARRQQQEQEEARRQQQEQEEARRQQQEQEEARRQQQEQEEPEPNREGKKQERQAERQGKGYKFLWRKLSIQFHPDRQEADIKKLFKNITSKDPTEEQVKKLQQNFDKAFSESTNRKDKIEDYKKKKDDPAQTPGYRKLMNQLYDEEVKRYEERFDNQDKTVYDIWKKIKQEINTMK